MLSILVIGDRRDVQQELPGNLSHDKLQEIFRWQLQYTEKREAGSYSHVISCHTVDELISSVVKLVRNCHHTVDLLDIVDHGGPGLMRLGKDVLFEFKDGQLAGLEVMQALSLLVSIDGRLRLLGCNTALEDNGRGLLTRTAAVSNFSLRMYGMIDRIKQAEFRYAGFSGAADLLFSSEAAIDHPAPSLADRGTNLGRAYGSGTTQRNPISNQIAASGLAFRHVISSE